MFGVTKFSDLTPVQTQTRTGMQVFDSTVLKLTPASRTMLCCRPSSNGGT